MDKIINHFVVSLCAVGTWIGWWRIRDDTVEAQNISFFDFARVEEDIDKNVIIYYTRLVFIYLVDLVLNVSILLLSYCVVDTHVKCTVSIV